MQNMITDYEHLPLGTYLAILAVPEDDEDRDLQIVALLAGRTAEELLQLPLTDYAALRDAASFLYFQPEPSRHRRSYDLGDFHDLRPCPDFRHLTTGQYIDFKEYAKLDGDHTAELLSVLLVPHGAHYADGSYDPLDLQAAIRERLCVPDALSLLDFFAARLGRSMRSTLTSLRQTLRRMRRRTTTKEMKTAIRALESFVRSGAGSSRSTASLRSRAPLGIPSIS